MFNWLFRKRVNHPDVPQFYRYHKGITFDPGAESYVFEPMFGNPVMMASGTGIKVGQMQTTQPMVFQSLALPTTGFAGSPVNMFVQQGLIKDPTLTDQGGN